MLAVSAPCGTNRSCVPVLHNHHNHSDVNVGGGVNSYKLQSRQAGKKLTIDLFEHLEHTLDIVMIEEPRLGILVVLLERYPERVGDVDRLAVILAEQHAHDAF